MSGCKTQASRNVSDICLFSFRSFLIYFGRPTAGVLAILAAKMGAVTVYGIDIDAVAAQSAFDNAKLNRVGTKVKTRYGDASLLQMGHYDVLLANIHRNIILMDLRTYATSLGKGGLLMLSGFYESDVNDIVAEAEANGLSLVRQRARNGWACLVLAKN